MKYTYSFCVWPDETRPWSKPTFETFKLCMGRTESLPMTEAEFAAFRDALLADGLTLREVERMVYSEWETVR